jgi:DNA-binding winged helix-turn-helix (wHTH) protein
VTFGDFRLDARARQLFRGSLEVHLSPKALDLLLLLIENRTRAVSKSEIHDRLWQGTFVNESNLPSLVAELRRVLGDESQTPKFIRTVHRFGYAFAGSVTEEAAGSAESGVSCWLVWRGKEIRLHEGENIIGRDPGATLRLDLPSVSRLHARVVVSDGTATIEDLKSKNGTLLKKQLVTQPTRLADLDELQIGSARVIVRVMAAGESTQTIER